MTPAHRILPGRPAPVATLPPRSVLKSVRFWMATNVRFWVAIDNSPRPLSRSATLRRHAVRGDGAAIVHQDVPPPGKGREPVSRALGGSSPRGARRAPEPADPSARAMAPQMPDRVGWGRAGDGDPCAGPREVRSSIKVTKTRVHVVSCRVSLSVASTTRALTWFVARSFATYHCGLPEDRPPYEISSAVDVIRLPGIGHHQRKPPWRGASPASDTGPYTTRIPAIWMPSCPLSQYGGIRCGLTARMADRAVLVELRRFLP